MSISRRNAIILIGAGTIGAMGAASAGFALTRTPHRAIEPWEMAGTYEDPRLNALSWAILAPNPHNRQPWVADLRQAGKVILLRDRARNLPETDPNDRQLTIGMGCFIELMALAAAEAGWRTDFDLFPKGFDGPVAIASFSEGAQADPLFRHALDRRSCKEPFEDRAVPGELVAALAPYATIIDAPDRVAALKALTWDAWKTEYETPRTFKESVDLMRFGRSEIEANPDGIDLGGAFLETLMLAGQLNRELQLDPTSFSAQEGVRMYKAMLEATPAYAALTSAANAPTDWIEAGRRWLRLNLATTSMGLSLHPVSQALQEFPEMAPHHAKAHELLAEPGHTVQMLGRLGYGPKTPRTPRWRLETRLIDGQAA